MGYGPISQGAELATVRVLACDWNGTLVDDVTRAWRATRAVMASRGMTEPDLRDFVGTFRLPLGAFFSALGVAEKDLAEAGREWNARMASERTLLMPGAIGMLDSLEEAGVAVGVISAAEQALVEKEIEELGLSGRFAFVLGSASPKRKELARLAESSAVVGRVAYLGDTEHDVEEALAVGIRAVGFGGGYRPKEALLAAGADQVVLDLGEIPEVLNQ